MSIDELRGQIQRQFGGIPPGRLPARLQPSNGSSAAQHAADGNALTAEGPGSSGASPLAQAPLSAAQWSAAAALQEHDGPFKQRHEVLPPVQHRFGVGPTAPDEQPTVAVYRHRLLQQFMLSIFCKLPVRPVTRMRDLRCVLCPAASIINCWMTILLLFDHAAALLNLVCCRRIGAPMAAPLFILLRSALPLQSAVQGAVHVAHRAVRAALPAGRTVCGGQPAVHIHRDGPLGLST